MTDTDARLRAEVAALRAEVALLRAELVEHLVAEPPAVEPERRLYPVPDPVPDPNAPAGQMYGELYKVEDAAKVLVISDRQAWRLVQSGELESIHVGRLRRVPASAIKDFVASHLRA